MSDMANQLDGANAHAASLAGTVKSLAAENRRLTSALARIESGAGDPVQTARDALR